MAEKTVHAGIAYRDQPGIRIVTKDGGFSWEEFRDWLHDNNRRAVRVTLEVLDSWSEVSDV